MIQEIEGRTVFYLTDAEIDVIGELVKDAVDYLPDPEDQPQPGSFAAVVTRLQRLFPSANFTGIVK
tara:strand:+ start:504 stop:701 length:198 start_codon:yes stop_codon:yes gene_type:complete